jgi:uncharacterized protein (DUF2236 family)
MEELEARKLAIKEEAKRKIDDAKKIRADEIKALSRVERQVRAKLAAEKRKAEDHAKILLGIITIDMANNDPSLKAKVEAHLRQFFAKSPGRIEAALKGLALTVAKPDNDAWKEDL